MQQAAQPTPEQLAICVSEASVHRTKGRSRVGKCSMGGVTKASHSCLNADCSDQRPVQKQSPCEASWIRGQQAVQSGRCTCYSSYTGRGTTIHA